MPVLFITVGSTGFDSLIEWTTSNEFLCFIYKLNIKRIIFQYGSSEPIFVKNIQEYTGPKMEIEGYRYKSSITNDILAADIIISHAGNITCQSPKRNAYSIATGSGTMLQTLRLSKKLIVVVNEALMDNHQYELAQAMDEKGYAVLSEIR